MNVKNQKALPYVANLDPFLKEELLEELKREGFEIAKPPHTHFQGKKKGITCTLYTSWKLVVQGKEAASFIEFYLEPQLLKTIRYGYSHLEIDKTPRIGVDEAGKGDFFGPLCIAGVYAGEKEVEELLRIGVKDSKRMQDSAIEKMAKLIRAKIPYHIVRISPIRYNELYSKFRNLNLFLAWGHATVIEALYKKTGCTRALIDQFSHLPLVEEALEKKNLPIDFSKKTKGEDDPVVAAASILARDAFVSGIHTLSEWIGLELPKGASARVKETGKRLFLEKGATIFDQLAKKHFKTFEEIVKSNLGEDIS